jgi:hypothetical protein
MAELGMDPDSIELIEIDTDAGAEGHAFVGSPTIRIAGRDIQPPGGDEPVGLNCRVYRRRDGRASPLPDPDDVRDALKEASDG